MFGFQRRYFSQNARNICILANSRQGDLIGSKIMQNLKKVSGGQEFTTSGYGGKWMKQEGFEPSIDFDIGQFMDKTFTTYRKGKVHREDIFFRWNPWNMINKHYTRNTDQIFDLVSESRTKRFR